MITMSSFILMYNVFLNICIKIHNNFSGKIIIIILVTIYIFYSIYNE
jgi:hypothetical protein